MIAHLVAHIRALQEAVADLRGELAQEKAARERMFRKGKVTDVDAKKGLYRQEVGQDEDGNPVKGPWVRYSQVAGGRKSHSPPSVGQQMILVAPDGDHEQAVGFPLGWSNDHKSPSDKGDEDVDQRGTAKDTTRADQRRIEVGGSSIDVNDGAIVISSGGVTATISSAGLKVDGGMVKHNAKNIGDSHVHGGVARGGAQTDPPA